MNTNIEFKNNYIKFLQATRTEMYYSGIDPVREVIKNHNLNSDEKIGIIDNLLNEFIDKAKKWKAEDYGVVF